MALRSSMADLISRLRRMIGDPAGPNQVWDDEDLQDILDGHREEARASRLTETPTIQAGGAIVYQIFTGPQNWEADATFADFTFAPVTPDTIDYLNGRFAFTTAPSWPIYITGFFYDLSGAAVEVLDAWAAREKLSFDAKADGHDLARSQKFKHLQEMADRYRKQARACTRPLCIEDTHAVGP